MNADYGSSEYVLPLADSRATLETVGGKGASLARLVAAGLPVPDGFHVTTAAYRRFVAENDLQPGILAALETGGRRPAGHAGDAPRRPSASCSPGRRRHPTWPAPSPWPMLRSPARQTPSSPCALRPPPRTCPRPALPASRRPISTSQGYGEVLEAVKRCWASLWTARAIGYRARQGIGPDGLSLAVVVQMLVPAEAAGILFTANPVTGRRDQAVISAAWGLGEAVVGGLVTPDTLTVDKATRRRAGARRPPTSR